MQFDTSNEQFQLAWHYVTETLRHVYLTGKAGTGKTTFLKYLKAHGTKNMVVVAPTGVAAINAGGVTMHSMFQLPLKPFVSHMPMGFGRNESVADKHSLLKNIRINDRKRKLLEQLELLVIDEVSMMRADHLEAIHHVLKHVRRNPSPFGGVQVLFIGDLYQLPPVVVESERYIIEEHYNSPFFFDAPIMQQVDLLYIELKQVYRQKDELFINLLNRLRNNEMSLDDFNTLYTCYAPDFEPTEEKYITVTSHNHKAEAINRTALEKLSSPKFSYEGIIEGDFGDNQLPTDRVMVLKEGAQVMFIRNDSNEEKRYYNGKLATVVALNAKEITVEFANDSEHFKVPREIWENITYRLNVETNVIEEHVAGTFTQFPLRLAWAITIHKSQGLTFERAIIDAGASFAPGQVYVALSRCTSMEGMKLLSKITPNVILSDTRIKSFAQKEVPSSTLKQHLAQDQKIYQLERFKRLFDLEPLLLLGQTFYQETFKNKTVASDSEIIEVLETVQRNIKDLSATAQKFVPELQQLIFQAEDARFLDRCTKAMNYFAKGMFDDVVIPLKKLRDALSYRKGVKTFEKELIAFQEEVWQKMERFHKITYKEKTIEINKDHLTVQVLPIVPIQIPVERVKKIKEKKTDKGAEKKPKSEKGQSARESFTHFQNGMSIEEIATLRNFAVSTIQGHLFQYIQLGELSVSQFIDQNVIDEVLQVHSQWTEEVGWKDIQEALQGKYNYWQIKLALWSQQTA